MQLKTTKYAYNFIKQAKQTIGLPEKLNCYLLTPPGRPNASASATKANPVPVAIMMIIFRRCARFISSSSEKKFG